MMKRQVNSILLAIALGLGVLCAFLTLGLFAALGGVSGVQEFIRRSQTLQTEIERIGSQPPDAVEAEAAFPAEVGTYRLTGEIETFFDFYLDDDAYTATYIGPEGEVELTLIRANNAGAAENYVQQRKDWIDQNLKATQTTVELPGKQLIIYDGPGRYGRIWNSRAWVIDIQAAAKTARDDFFEVFPYR
jgi:hypothetical protein